MENKLNSIIKHYRNWRQENPDTWLEHCKNQNDLSNAIKYAAWSVDHTGKKHPHQQRLNNQVLDQFAGELLQKHGDIENAGSFDELLKIVESASINGTGEMVCYDTAVRIGAFVGLSPQKVYLHRETRTGAEKLLGRKISKNNIEKEELPHQLQDPDLTCGEIEDILCIYKDKFE